MPFVGSQMQSSPTLAIQRVDIHIGLKKQELYNVQMAIFGSYMKRSRFPVIRAMDLQFALTN